MSSRHARNFRSMNPGDRSHPSPAQPDWLFVDWVNASTDCES